MNFVFGGLKPTLMWKEEWKEFRWWRREPEWTVFSNANRTEHSLNMRARARVCVCVLLRI